MVRYASFFVALLFFLVSPTLAQTTTTDDDAQASDDPEMTVGIQGGKFGIGTASSWPAYGLSGTYQANERVTAQAVLGFFGTISTFSGRAWYRFTRSADYDLYGYAGAGVYRYSYNRFLLNRNETVLGLGAGVGIETSLARLFDDEDFPPIFANAELGLSYADFDVYNFTPVTFGFGIHYRFGDR